MHKQEIRSLMCAMLLGDSYIHINSTPGHTGGDFRTEHSFAQEDYILWKASLIDEIFRKKGLERRCRVYRRRRKPDKRTGKVYCTITTVLSWKSYMRHLRNRTYLSNRKKNVEYLLSQVETPKHLAIWFMDDASESRTKAKHKDGTRYYKNPYFRLATNDFTEGQCNLIIQWFERHYGVSPKKNKQQDTYILRFSVADSKKLFPKIRPYVVQLESMRTKFRLCLERY